MSKQSLKVLSWVLLLGWPTGQAIAQALTLRQAVQTALNNYGTIRAKADYVKAARANVREVKNEYLPDLNLSAEQVYGTANSSYGPAIGYKAPSASSSGPVLPSQSWNAAFGSLYWTNINWDFFQFGRYKEKAKVAQRGLDLNQSDLDQEKFEQSVRVSGAFLNLIAAQMLISSQQANLDRAISFQTVVTARAKSGLNPGVDSSLANAEVSNARIALTSAIEAEQEYANELAQLMQVRPPDSNNYSLDSGFVSRLPNALNTPSTQLLTNHPLLQFFQERVLVSDQQAKYLRTLNYPTFSLFGVFQERGTGFDYNYGAQNPNAYTPNYFKGVGFQSANYLIPGVGVYCGISPIRCGSVSRWRHRILRPKGYGSEYGLINQELQATRSSCRIPSRSGMRWRYYREAPVQVKAACGCLFAEGDLIQERAGDDRGCERIAALNDPEPGWRRR